MGAGTVARLCGYTPEHLIWSPDKEAIPTDREENHWKYGRKTLEELGWRIPKVDIYIQHIA